ncbi:MAG: hypothetical protein P1P64_09160 [Treponemataceae bacterium]
MVVAKDAVDKTTNKLYGDILVQALWRNEENFKKKTAKRTRFTQASKNYKILIDKENWIEEYLNSDIVKNTWKEPLPLNEKEKLLMSTDFSSSLSSLKGLNKQGKFIELEMFIYDYIYLGLDLLYDKQKWFFESKKYILEDINKKNPDVWKLIKNVYNSKSTDNKIYNFEKFYNYIIKALGEIPKEYTIYW